MEARDDSNAHHTRQTIDLYGSKINTLAIDIIWRKIRPLLLDNTDQKSSNFIAAMFQLFTILFKHSPTNK